MRADITSSPQWGRSKRAEERVEVRIAIATGLVVVGDLIGGGVSEEQAMVGDTPNIAAQLRAWRSRGGSRCCFNAPPAWRFIHFSQPPAPRGRGHLRTHRGLGGRRCGRIGESRFEAVRSNALDCLCRPQGRDRVRALAPASGVAGPRPGGVDFRRGGDRQIARALREPCVGVAPPSAVSVLAVPHEQCAPIPSSLSSSAADASGYRTRLGKSSTSRGNTPRLERSRWRQRRRSLPRFFRSQPASAIRRSP